VNLEKSTPSYAEPSGPFVIQRTLIWTRVKPYLYATGLFDRAWPRFRGPIETHVQAFIDGKTTLDQMASALAAAVP